jgi:hypothetical protein
MHTNNFINFISRIVSDLYSVYVYIFIFLFGCLGTTFPSFCPNFSDPTDLSESRSVSSRSDFRMSDDHPCKDVLKGRSGARPLPVVVYLDDIAVFGDDQEQVLEDTLEAVRRLTEAGFMINLTKSQLVESTAKVLGH